MPLKTGKKPEQSGTCFLSTSLTNLTKVMKMMVRVPATAIRPDTMVDTDKKKMAQGYISCKMDGNVKEIKETSEKLHKNRSNKF